MMIICSTLPAIEDNYTVDADRKCTILYLFHIPNNFCKFRVGDYVLCCCNQLSFYFKTIQVFACHFVCDDVNNSSVIITHAILYVMTTS